MGTIEHIAHVPIQQLPNDHGLGPPAQQPPTNSTQRVRPPQHRRPLGLYFPTPVPPANKRTTRPQEDRREPTRRSDKAPTLSSTVKRQARQPPRLQCGRCQPSRSTQATHCAGLSNTQRQPVRGSGRTILHTRGAGANVTARTQRVPGYERSTRSGTQNVGRASAGEGNGTRGSCTENSSNCTWMDCQTTTYLHRSESTQGGTGSGADYGRSGNIQIRAVGV